MQQAEASASPSPAQQSATSVYVKAVHSDTLNALSAAQPLPGCPLTLAPLCHHAVPASLSTYLACQAFDPDLIISAGTAGGFKARVRRFDPAWQLQNAMCGCMPALQARRRRCAVISLLQDGACAAVSPSVFVCCCWCLQGAAIGDVFVSTGKMHHDRRIPLPGFDKQVCFGGATQVPPDKHMGVWAVSWCRWCYAADITGHVCITSCMHARAASAVRHALMAATFVLGVWLADGRLCCCCRAWGMLPAHPHPSCRRPSSSRQALSHQVGHSS
jgi:hypothetical protein